jgi:hypothetical protein
MKPSIKIIETTAKPSQCMDNACMLSREADGRIYDAVTEK